MKRNKKICILLITIALLFLVSIKKSDAASVLWPIGGDNAEETYIEYGYGRRFYQSQAYIDKCKNDYGMDVYEVPYSRNENHYGVDIFGKPGNTYSVVAVADGKVVATSANYAGYWSASTNYINRNQRLSYYGRYDGGGYGNFVIIEDSKTKQCYLYGHLNAGTISVSKGDTVSAGQEIAKMGSSGDSGHMHLHFEVRKNIYKTLASPYTQYTYLIGTREFDNDYSETENPVKYIGNSYEKTVVEDNTVKITHDEAKLYVKHLFRNALGREANVEEEDLWANAYEREYDISDPARGIILSVEGTNHLGNLNNYEFIKFVYKTLLLRNETPVYSEYSIYLNGLNNGTMNRHDVIRKICETEEFRNNTLKTIIKNEEERSHKDIKYIDAMAEKDKMSKVGDLNGDGYIDARDASLALSLYFANDDTYEYYSYVVPYADINQDGYVDARDASKILRYYALCSTSKINPEQTSIVDYFKNNNY